MEPFFRHFMASHLSVPTVAFDIVGNAIAITRANIQIRLTVSWLSKTVHRLAHRVKRMNDRRCRTVEAYKAVSSSLRAAVQLKSGRQEADSALGCPTTLIQHLTRCSLFLSAVV